MHNRLLVTISGVPGTGTTTIAELVSERLHLRMLYAGETFRKLAKKYKMTLSEFSVYAENNPEIDKELDSYQLEEARTGNVLLEGRLSAWLSIEYGLDAYRILLTAELDTRIKRIMGRENKEYDVVKAEIEARERSEFLRYMKLYDVDYQNPIYYDLVVDTTTLTPKQILERIITSINEKYGPDGDTDTR